MPRPVVSLDRMTPLLLARPSYVPQFRLAVPSSSLDQVQVVGFGVQFTDHPPHDLGLLMAWSPASVARVFPDIRRKGLRPRVGCLAHHVGPVLHHGAKVGASHGLPLRRHGSNRHGFMQAAQMRFHIIFAPIEPPTQLEGLGQSAKF